jgi:hypothetical protein
MDWPRQDDFGVGDGQLGSIASDAFSAEAIAGLFESTGLPRQTLEMEDL